MPESSSLYIVDTNIFIDLWNGSVLAEFFQLPYPFASPDVVIAELRKPEGSKIVELGLQSLRLDAPQVEEVITLRAKNKTLSTPDIFAFVASRYHNATMLTGDSRLRALADKHGIPVHGTLWVLDELVRFEILSTDKAAKALREMLDAGSHLPPKSCQTRLERWRQ